jgi:hypothetical protein
MTDYYYLDKNNNAIPCSMEEWGMQREEMRNNHTKHIAEETINNKWISTVWLGLNHQWMPGGPPLLFETMVFDYNDKGREIYGNRYSTYQEALEGHKKAVEWVKNGCKEEDCINE